MSVEIALLMLAGVVTAASPSLEVAMESSRVVDSKATEVAALKLRNRSDKEVVTTIEYSVQLNSQYDIPIKPDAALGFDHARGCVSTVTIDGKDFGDAKLTDGNRFRSFESPWGKGYGEAVVGIDLGQVRDVQAMGWTGADANWIWLVDVSTSRDGVDFVPVPSLQKFSMHKKWGQNRFPFGDSVKAKYLKFRFYRDDGPMNVVRLPRMIEVFDGASNDPFEKPSVGPVHHRGQVETRIAAGSEASVPVDLESPLPPGSYLLTWSSSETQPGWEPFFVKPGEPPAKEQARRFGINASNIKLADAMAECGFGWVRFENGKWIMSSDARDHYDFRGGVAPWHVNQDKIYETYQKHGFKILPYVFQTPEWATSAGAEIKTNRKGYPPRNAADYGEAIFQFVARFGTQTHRGEQLKTDDKTSGLDRIDAIEMWNEPNLVGPSWAPFVGSIEQYFDVMREGVLAARRADPNLIVTSCGWAGIEPATLQKMTSHRYADGTRPLDLVDVINVHFYSGVQEPEIALEDPNIRDKRTDKSPQLYLDQLDELIRWRDANKSDAEIWMTETGYDVGGPIGLSERKQAAKIPRVTMITLARGIDKVFLYRESGSQESMHAGAGLIRDDGTLRPSWFTTATLIRQLAGFEGKARRLKHADKDVWLLRWERADRIVIAAWAIGDPVAIEVNQLGGRPSKIVDAFGHPIDTTTQSLDLGEFPVYVTIAR